MRGADPETGKHGEAGAPNGGATLGCQLDAKGFPRTMLYWPAASLIAPKCVQWSG
jgi:hypothetical protein